MIFIPIDTTTTIPLPITAPVFMVAAPGILIPGFLMDTIPLQVGEPLLVLDLVGDGDILLIILTILITTLSIALFITHIDTTATPLSIPTIIMDTVMDIGMGFTMGFMVMGITAHTVEEISMGKEVPPELHHLIERFQAPDLKEVAVAV